MTFIQRMLALVALSATSLVSNAAETIPLGGGANIRVYISPQDPTATAVCEAINGARARVLMAAYTLSHPDIAACFVKASQKPHLDVRAVLDAGQAGERYSGLTYLRNNKVKVRVSTGYAAMHHKFIVIDNSIVGLGSANFTRAGMSTATSTRKQNAQNAASKSAKYNAENFNLITGVPQLVAVYAQTFQQLYSEAE